MHDRRWVQTSIDRFILARLDAIGRKPAPPADRRVLLRRVTYDLTGLPPTYDDLCAFERDTSPGALDAVVDRLLASPQYGEHWGRHWLDVVRYADTAGETSDVPVPLAWRYRNYVIDAFNADKPYDEFLREQIRRRHPGKPGAARKLTPSVRPPRDFSPSRGDSASTRRTITT